MAAPLSRQRHGAADLIGGNRSDGAAFLETARGGDGQESCFCGVGAGAHD